MAEKSTIRRSPAKRVDVTEELEVSPPKVVPKIYINKDERIKAKVTAYYTGDTGDFSFCVPGESLEENENFIRLVHEFEFSPMSYRQLNAYRVGATTFEEDKVGTINLIRLRNYYWIWHLKAWNFKDANAQPIPIQTTTGGGLTSATLEVLDSISPAILDTAIGIYESKMGVA